MDVIFNFRKQLVRDKINLFKGGGFSNGEQKRFCACQRLRKRKFMVLEKILEAYLMLEQLKQYHLIKLPKSSKKSQISGY